MPKDPSVNLVNCFCSNFSDMVVTVTAGGLRTDAVFNSIRDAVISLARRAIQQFDSPQENDANDDQKWLSTVREYNSDNDTDSEGDSQNDEEINDE